ncbi:mycofactocin-coupled SDR family oxidoreductase [Streptomyces canus]|uniref:mycofactocin-coupled SDR family oxidoreductase n=1 Tax=Streptomyces canus TaxID=58343 RepID=UPI003717C5DA
MGRFDGKVVFITGVARGQGRSHALRFAQEGASIVGLDIAEAIPSVTYAAATADDLAETVDLLDRAGAKSIIVKGDVRDQAAIDELVERTLSTFGQIDVVLPQAGITTLAKFWELSDQQWDDMIGVNLTGVWRTLRATIPTMIEKNAGGSIVLTGSIAGLAGMPHAGHYAATKHGINGIVKTLANELAPHRIRVNSVNPTNVATKMILDDEVYKIFRPDLDKPTLEDARPAFGSYLLLDQPWVESDEVSSAVLWLCSGEARSITGVQLPIDAGTLVKWPGA